MSEQSMPIKKLRSYDEACSEVEREMNVRSRCFPRWITEGKVNRVDAQDRLDRLGTALQLLERADVKALLIGTETAGKEEGNC